MAFLHICTLLLTQSLAALPPQQVAMLDNYLILGEVTSVNVGAGGTPAATVRILRVYYGPGSLSGIDFVDTLSDDRPASNPTVDAPYKVGEVGIWCCKLADGHIRTSQMPFMYFTRHRQAYSPRFAANQKLAENIERLSKLNPIEQSKLVRELLASDTPEVALWGYQLCRFNISVDLFKFNRDVFFSDKVNVSVLIKADTYLTDRLGRTWIQNGKRLEALDRMANGFSDEAVGIFFVNDLTYRSQGREPAIPPLLAQKLITRIACRDTELFTIRASAISQLYLISQQSDLIDPVFDAYIGILDNTKDVKLRALAATKIGYVPNSKGSFGRAVTAFNSSQLGKLQIRFEAERDPKVATELKAVILKHAK